MKRPALTLFNAAAHPLIWGGTLVYAVVGGLSVPVSPSGRLYLRTARAWSRYLFRMSRATVTSTGADGVDWSRPFIIMSNHQSHFDIPCLFATVPADLRFLSKHELAWIPIFGWSMWAAGFIFINRGNQKKAFASIEAAIRAVQQGRSIVVFPEGTRSEDGVLKPFKKGAFHLAAQAGVQIVPTWIDGSREVFHKGEATIFPGHRVEVRFGRPFVPIEGPDDQVRADIAERVRVELERLAKG